MKMKYVVLALISFAVGYAKAQNTSAIDSNYIFSGYTEKMELFNKMPVLKGAVVFLGNSLTDAGRWNDIIPDQPVLNRGISGDISFGVLARLDEVLRHQPEKIFLMIGVNDLKRGVPTAMIAKNYQRIAAKIHQQSPKTKLYLNSIMPINPNKLIESFKAVTNADIAHLNVALRAMAAESKWIHFVDLHKVVADKDGNLRAEITPDGIHLEVAAYVELVDYLKKVKAL